MTTDPTDHHAVMAIGVDVGGTFTDAALVDEGAIITAKVATTRDDHGVGVLDAISQVLEAAARSPQDVRRIAHGMTVGTNALLENRLARTAFVATRGLGGILELR